jgi:hypothetical protein
VRGSTDELFAELDVAARFQADCVMAAPDDAVPVADVHTTAVLWLQREGLEADARPLMGELRKRMGERYAFRKIDCKSVRVFTGARLLLDTPCPPQLRRDCSRCLSANPSRHTGHTCFNLSD